MPLYRSAPLSLSEPRGRSLQDWVDRSLSTALSEARSRGTHVLHVSTRKFDRELPLGVLDSPVGDVHFFGGGGRATLGVGVAKAFEHDSPKHFGNLTRKGLLGLEALSTSDPSRVVVMGGWGFPPTLRQRKKGIWRDFSRSRWVIPALTLTHDGRETHITLVAHVRPSSEPAPLRLQYRGLVRGLEFYVADTPVAGLPPLEGRRSMPSPKRWVSLAEEALESISGGELSKVVLSRALALAFRERVPASAVLRKLVSLNPDSTVFAIKRKGSIFLGATPEGLVSVKRGEVEVGCLAASSPRGEDREADATLGARLLADPKSAREHRFVVQAAVRALSPISSRIEVPGAPVLKKLTTIQHLYTPVKATLRDGEDVWTVASALWPNPAIGGEPRERAVAWIRRSERLDRGWFSGVVGHLNLAQDEADLVVGIRSGVIRGKNAVIYAGAGIVAGSDPERELEETEWKLRTMSMALGIDGAAAGRGR